MKYNKWLDIPLANYVKPTVKSKTYKSYQDIAQKHIKKISENVSLIISPIAFFI